ncbi:thioredoxin domain-containing protein [Rhizobium sp. LjRoot30]|uniref:thioredoxin domain-containing protein n=1 Tax=Rhizobium sp. LjRoot30 TaxID=3342320 RepID=UPI003ECD1681
MRILTVLLSSILLSVAAVSAHADSIMAPEGYEDRFLGSAAAPKTLVVYSSPTCPHCVDFEKKVLPDLEKRYIQNGKLKVTIRPFVRNAIDAVIFMLAESAGDADRDRVIAAFTSRLDDIFSTEEKERLLREIASANGIDNDTFNAAVKNEAIYDKLNRVTSQAVESFGVTGTPSFFLDGLPLEYDGTLSSFAAVEQQPMR